MIDEIRLYIKEGWLKSVIHAKEENSFSMALPHPYVPPCYDGIFKTLIYWDTYFTNKGLIQDGFLDLAIHNVENIFFAIDQLGFVPNGLAKDFFSRSQPPLLTLCVKDIFVKTNDLKWLDKAIGYVIKEYDFWMNQRITPLGLNRYGNQASDEELAGFWLYVKNRLKFDEIKVIQLEKGSHFLSEAESGWDFTPRFNQRCNDYAPVDLNSILYLNEITIAQFCEKTKRNTKKVYFLNQSVKRKALINQYLLREDGIYLDYNFITKKHSNVISAASFLPYYASIVTEQIDSSVKILLHELELVHGLSACMNSNHSLIYQWDYPNMWPPLVYFAFEGLSAYGYLDDAQRIAHKYIMTVNQSFKTSSSLWEKYDALLGDVAKHNEYPMTKMLGWTAGVYVHLTSILKIRSEDL